MWAPEIGPSMVISTNNMAPVARVLPSSATAAFPPASASAMMPDPMTVANRKKEPSPSAARRRASGRASAKLLRLPRPANLFQSAGKRKLVEAFQRQGEEQVDPALELLIGGPERLVLAFALDLGRVLYSPMGTDRLAGPDGTELA